jgi:hypothetical protein
MRRRLRLAAQNASEFYPLKDETPRPSFVRNVLTTVLAPVD